MSTPAVRLPQRAGPSTPDPRPAIPNGWLGIAYSREVGVGQVLSRHILGRDLVLFRGNSGQLSVADAYCPHLGAHLGDGEVVGDCLQCPFHHWKFAADGACAEVPYWKAVPKTRLNTWPVREINGFVFVWHHAGGAAPSWEIPPHPLVDDASYAFITTREHLFRGHPQDISENGADFAHFIAIHGWDGVKLKFTPQDHTYRVGYDTEGVDTGYGEAGAVEVDSLAVGPGYTYTHYSGERDWLMMSCFTPVDPGMVYLHQIYYARRDLSPQLMRTLIDAVDAEWCKDIRIWEGKAYWDAPAVVGGDGPIGQFRRWYQQFYV